jgi:chemotaxis protein CheC
MCNIFTSGFIDGLANTLGRSIGMGTPGLERGTGRELMTANLSHITEGSLAIVLDSQVDVTEPRREFRIRIFLVPDPGAFVNVLDHLEVEEIRTEEPDVAGL